MENKKLEKIINEFMDFCEKKNYRGVIVASDKNYQNNFAGNFADNIDITFLLRNFLINFQEKTGTSATAMATHLALSMAIMDISKSSEEPLEEVDAEILEKAMAIVKDCMEKELEQTRTTEAKG